MVTYEGQNAPASLKSIDVVFLARISDQLSEPTPISSTPYSNSVRTEAATSSTDEPLPSCGNRSTARSVWYQFRVPANGQLTVDTFGSSYDTILSKWTRNAGNLQEGACSDNAPGVEQSRIIAPASVNADYLFMVSATNGDGGLLTFNLELTLDNPVPIVGAALPSSIVVGDLSITLTVNGSGFVQGSVLRWNASDRPTTFVSDTQLTAAIPASDLALGGIVQITVFNPAPGGGTSNAVTVTVNNSLPTQSGVSPANVMAGGAAFTLTSSGSGFINGSIVRWNGSDRPTTFVSSTQLKAAIPVSDLAAGGNVQITVFNPAPGGGTSTAVSFAVTDFTASAAPTTATVKAGQSATYTITVTPQFGPYGNAVTLSLSGLPTLSTGVFSAVSVTPGSSPATATLTISTTASSAMFRPPRILPVRVPALTLLAALVLLSFLRLGTTARARRLLVGASLAFVFIGAVLQMGCTSVGSKAQSPGTPPGTYSVTVTGQSGTVQHSTTLTLTVQ